METSPRHSETMKVGDRDWFVDVGLLNVHKVGGWESDDIEHLSVIIWQVNRKFQISGISSIHKKKIT